jgi:pimeloyl-ACP methyl ester carboxylesterase
MHIVYLHGFASSPASRKANFFRDRLAGRGIPVEVPDLAAGDFEALTLTGQLKIIESVAAGRAVSLIGSSMGGYLAALYAARHPEVERLVLLAPAFGFARRWAASIPTGELRNWRRAGYRLVHHYGLGRDEKIGYQLLEDGLRYEDFPVVMQPTLIVHGTRDTVVPPSISEQYANLRPNVRLRFVDSDHELATAFDAIWVETRQFLEL